MMKLKSGPSVKGNLHLMSTHAVYSHLTTAATIKNEINQQIRSDNKIAVVEALLEQHSDRLTSHVERAAKYGASHHYSVFAKIDQYERKEIAQAQAQAFSNRDVKAQPNRGSLRRSK